MSPHPAYAMSSVPQGGGDYVSNAYAPYPAPPGYQCGQYPSSAAAGYPAPVSQGGYSPGPGACYGMPPPPQHVMSQMEHVVKSPNNKDR